MDELVEKRVLEELSEREKHIKHTVFSSLEHYRIKIKNEVEKEYITKLNKLEDQIKKERVELKTELSKTNKLKSKLKNKLNEVEHITDEF